jgi:HD-GYP domain-containing protein (c-di-GMP phosphodiesterase class II)
MHFRKQYKDITEIVYNHHEFLDGSGYPRGLNSEQISLETRLLTIVDIFESLTAQDRPYRKALDISKGYAVLIELADSGKLDKALVELFIASRELIEERAE